MPSTDSTAVLVARFLRANGYDKSFEAFIAEAGLAESAGDINAGDMTIERLLEEKRIFDKSIAFEKLNISDDNDAGWHEPAPTVSTKVTALPKSVNVLSAMAQNAGTGSVLVASTTDKYVRAVALPDLELTDSFSVIRDAPTLSQLVLNDRYHVASLMSGELIISDILNGHILHRRKDHAKYVVSVISHQDSTNTYIATAGWDNKVIIYNISTGGSEPASITLNEVIGTIALATKPESILFVEHPVDKQPIMIVTRTDSSHLHFYTVRGQVALLGKQDLAPYSNAWVAFTPSCIALCPRNPGLIAVATNSTPHMKLLVVQLLLPDLSSEGAEPHQTRLDQTRAAQVVADREYDAIKLHCNTLSPQTPYSTPIVVWRPHGKGVWVNSDDGIIRGIDTISGKIVHKLKAHDDGSKVRTLWAGNVDVKRDGTEVGEWLISGGFDHNLFIWRPSDPSD